MQVTVRQGEGRKDRVAFLGAKARKSLLKYLMTRGSTRPEDALWPAQDDGRRLTRSGLLQMLKRLGKHSGVARCPQGLNVLLQGTVSGRPGMELARQLLL